MPSTLHLVRDLGRGGAQTQLARLAAATRDRGDRVTVASLLRPGAVAPRLRAAGVEVVWLGWRFPFDPFVCRRLNSLVRGGRYDTLLTWDPPSGRHALATLAGRRRPALWMHAVRELGEPGRVEARVRRSADRLVAPGPTLVAALRSDPRLRGDRVSLLPNEADMSAADLADRAAVLRRLGLPAETRLIAAAMRMDRARLAKELVWAADLVRVVRPEMRLVLVGGGPARPRVVRFARHAAEAGLATLPGERDDWPSVLAAADVVWCASASPDTPTPLVEAVRGGKAVVASVAPGREPPPGDEGEAGGWLTAWDDRAGWARPTVRMLEDEATRSRLAEAARRAASGPAGDGLLARFDRAASAAPPHADGDA